MDWLPVWKLYESLQDGIVFGIMNRQSFDAIVIGGGIIGCALARELAHEGCDVAVLEKESALALHTSGRNSGVVHAGFNAKPGTLKARLCLEGNQAIRRFVQEHEVPYEQTGTWVVATDEKELDGLRMLKRRGDQNGVPGLELVDGRELARQEPNSRGLWALFAPTGGLIDAQALTRAVAQDAQRLGATILSQQRVVDLREQADAISCSTGTHRFTAGVVINCAGLYADTLAHAMGVGLDYCIVPFRGSYFSIRRSTPIVRSMLYPVPDLTLPFLGVHVTNTLHGSVLVGPDAMPAMGREAYEFSAKNLWDLGTIAGHRFVWRMLYRYRRLLVRQWGARLRQRRKHYFWKSASRLVRGLQEEELIDDARVGIRPQLVHQSGELVEDLLVQRTERSIHVLNVVSPGMTCSLAFARWLVDCVIYRSPVETVSAG